MRSSKYQLKGLEYFILQMFDKMLHSILYMWRGNKYLVLKRIRPSSYSDISPV